MIKNALEAIEIQIEKYPLQNIPNAAITDYAASLLIPTESRPNMIRSRFKFLSTDNVCGI